MRSIPCNSARAVIGLPPVVVSLVSRTAAGTATAIMIPPTSPTVGGGVLAEHSHQHRSRGRRDAPPAAGRHRRRRRPVVPPRPARGGHAQDGADDGADAVVLADLVVVVVFITFAITEGHGVQLAAVRLQHPTLLPPVPASVGGEARQGLQRLERLLRRQALAALRRRRARGRRRTV